MNSTQPVNEILGVHAELIAVLVAILVSFITTVLQVKTWKEQKMFAAFQFLIEQDRRLGSEEFLNYRRSFKAYVAGDRSEESDLGFRELLNFFDNLGVFAMRKVIKIEDLNQFFGTFILTIYQDAFEHIPRVRRDFNNDNIYVGLEFLHRQIRTAAGR